MWSGGVPVELFEKFEGESFLAFEAKGINRIQLVDGRAADQFLEELRQPSKSVRNWQVTAP